MDNAKLKTLWTTRNAPVNAHRLAFSRTLNLAPLGKVLGPRAMIFALTGLVCVNAPSSARGALSLSAALTAPEMPIHEFVAMLAAGALPTTSTPPAQDRPLARQVFASRSETFDVGEIPYDRTEAWFDAGDARAVPAPRRAHIDPIYSRIAVDANRSADDEESQWVFSRAPDRAIPSLEFVVELRPEGIILPEGALALANIGDSIRFNFRVEGAAHAAHVVVRKREILAWNQAESVLTALSSGASELYIMSGKHLAILPVTVAAPDSSVAIAGGDLFAPPASLTQVMLPRPRNVKADFAGGAVAEAEDQQEIEMPASLSDSEIPLQLPTLPTATMTAHPLAAVGVSLSTSRQATLDSMTARASPSIFKLHPQRLEFGQVAIQVLDDRSIPELSRLYPVGGMSVRIVGSNVTADTDATGHVVFRDIPVGSRVMVTMSDKHGRVLDSMHEVFVGEAGDNGVARLTTLRRSFIDAVAGITGSVPNSALGSLCLTVVEGSGNARLAGATGSLNVAADGPFFFNRLGYLDPSQKMTSEDGRMCFLNVETGPVHATLSRSERGNAATAIFPIIAGAHYDDVFNIDGEAGLATEVAAEPSAQEQLGFDAASQLLQPVGGVSMLVAGSGDSLFEGNAEYILETNDVTWNAGAGTWLVANTAEFEPSIQRTPLDILDVGVTRLFPRGFLEDMAGYADQSLIGGNGSLILEYGAQDGQSGDAVTFHIYDAFGNSIGPPPWHFSEVPTTRAISFSIPPGVYSVLVDDAAGNWLASDTVIVYSDTLSVVILGSTFAPTSVRPNSKPSQHAAVD